MKREAPALIVLTVLVLSACIPLPTPPPSPTGTATATATPIETITPDGTEPAPLLPPAADDWDAGVVAFSQGAEGEWDHILWGAFANSLIQRGDTYYLYYQGSLFYDDNCESVAHRAIGLATSTDGVHWTKHPGNPVITWSSRGSVEEGAVSSAAWLGGDGRIYIYYGANTGTGCNINASARLAVSEDGVTFQDLGEVLSGQDPNVWGSGDEVFPLGVYTYQNRWHLYYTPNGVPLSRKLGVAIGDSPTSFTQSMGVSDPPVSGWGSVSVIEAGGQSVLVTNPDGVNGAIHWYRFDAANPAAVQLHDAYILPNCRQASVIHEGDTGHWMLSCRDEEAGNYYIRNAYLP